MAKLTRMRQPDVQRHEAAREARAEFARVVDALKAEGIERQAIARMFGVPAPHISRWSAAEVKDRPTLAPPESWRTVLAGHLRVLSGSLMAIADQLAPSSMETVDPPPSALQPTSETV